jgi:hypothetical protein
MIGGLIKGLASLKAVMRIRWGINTGQQLYSLTLPNSFVSASFGERMLNFVFQQPLQITRRSKFQCS